MKSKNRLIRDIRRLFNKKKKVITNQEEWVILGIPIMSNMKVVLIEIKKLSVKEHIDKIKPYMRDTEINLQKSDT